MLRACWLWAWMGLAVPAAGQWVQVDTVWIEGNAKTRAWVLLREMALLPGDSVAASELDRLIERSRQNLYNLGLFNEVLMEPVLREGRLRLRVRVRERWFVFGAPYVGLEERNAFDFVGAFRTRSFRRLVYGGSVTWRNATGRNETLYAFANLGFSQRLLIEYLQPAAWRRQNIDLRAVLRAAREPEIIAGTAGGRVQWRDLRSGPLLQMVSGAVSLKKRLALNDYAYVEAAWRRYRAADSLYLLDLGYGPLRFLTSPNGVESYPSVTAGYIRDLRDNRSYPLRGYRAHVFGKYAGPELLGSTAFAKLGGSWAQFFPLSRRWNVACGIQSIYTFGDSVPFFDKSVVGLLRYEFQGISTELRGYEPYLLTGTWVHFNKAELKYGIVPWQILHLPAELMPFRQFRELPVGLYATLFCDTGYIADQSFSNQDQTFRGRWLLGYGAGLNVVWGYDLLLRIEGSGNHLGQFGLYLQAILPIK
ncbi:MAG: BamA/TamA family outer membrane protein [Bacteroidia bacterium]|nr:BamA/TamA family outer membrane protein [Bacteroidia bacterium]